MLLVLLLFFHFEMAFDADEFCENIKHDYDWENLFGVEVDEVDYDLAEENESTDFYYTVYVTGGDTTVAGRMETFLRKEFEGADIHVCAL